MTAQYANDVLDAFVGRVRDLARGYAVGNAAIPVDDDGVDLRPPYLIVDAVTPGAPRAADMGGGPNVWEWTFQVRAVGERADQVRNALGWIFAGILGDGRGVPLTGEEWYEFSREWAEGGEPPPAESRAGVVSGANRYTFAIGSY